MWKDYSSGYLKNNRASGISVMAAALISSLLLSLLSGLFYNLWIYEVERIKMEEGGWQAQICGEIGTEELAAMQSHANVEKAVVREDLSDDAEKVVDIYLYDKRSVFEDLPEIAGMAHLPAEAVTYHYELLNLYLIRDADDAALRWVFPFALAVTAVACLSLVMIIHNAFAVTMNARIHQFGIFASIGATPRQIRTCLLQEAFALCGIPIVVGNLSGILLATGIVEGTNVMLADVEGRLSVPFSYHPLIFLLSLLAAALTIWLSAWIPAGKLSRMTPLEAIRNSGEFSLKKKKNSRVLSCLFGIEGELAGNALKAQKKALRTANLSLVLSFLAFSFMMCFLTITIVSQEETYFAKYQDAWDVMATVRGAEIDAFDRTDALRGLDGVQSCVVYQKAAAKRLVMPDEISGEMKAAGGFDLAPAEYVSAVSGGWMVNAPVVILDDAGFLEYCGQIGVMPQLSGAVILNRTRDAADPNFRERRELSYLKETGETTILWNVGGEDAAVEIPVTAYTAQPPVLREEYGTLDFYELVHFIPLSLWKEIKGQTGNAEEELYIRILAEDRTSLHELDEIEESVSELLNGTYDMEIENRIQDKLNNDRMFAGMKAILGVFCLLLAVIGFGNIFSNTLGFVRQRKREFARLLSIGLTPAGMKKIFCIEALVIAGRPALIALPITGAAVVFFLKISYLEPEVFLREAPILPILAFLLAIFGFVALAYYLGAKKVMESSLIDSLRDDTLI